MIIEIWKLAIKTLPILAIAGATMFVIGSIGDKKIIKNKTTWKKLGLAIIVTILVLVIVQMIITYTLLNS